MTAHGRHERPGTPSSTGVLRIRKDLPHTDSPSDVPGYSLKKPCQRTNSLNSRRRERYLIHAACQVRIAKGYAEHDHHRVGEIDCDRIALE